MTRSEIELMEAGPQMDALVAEHVMRISRRVSSKVKPQPYSTDIAAAWQVVNKLADAGQVVVIKADGLRGGNNPRFTVLIDNHRRVDDH